MKLYYHRKYFFYSSVMLFNSIVIHRVLSERRDKLVIKVKILWRGK